MANYPLGIDVVIKGLSGLNQVNTSLNRIEKQGASLASTFRLVRGLFLALGGGVVIGSLVNISVAAEKARYALNGLAGSTIAGGKAFDTATAFAKQYGFAQQDVLTATQDLLRAGGVEQLVPNLQQAAAASRAFGIDFKTAASQIVLAKENGLGSTKDLYEGLRTRYGAIVETVKNSASGSAYLINKYLGKDSEAFSSVTEGADGLQAAFARLQDSWRDLGLEITGTDYAGNINAISTAVNFLKNNFKELELAIGAALGLITYFIPGAGWIKFLTGVASAIGLIDGFRRTWKESFGSTEADTKTTADALGVLNRTQQELNAGLSAYIELQKQSNDATKTSIEDDIKKNEILFGIQDAWKKINEANNVTTVTTNSIMEAYNSLHSAASDALISIINGSKSAAEAGRQLGKAIVDSILKGLIDLAFAAWIFPRIKMWLEEMFPSLKVEKQLIDDTNRSLTKQIGLRLALMALGFAGGGAVQAGGQPMQTRAIGGPTAGNMPYLVGERGPEMFVPSSNGMIIPNDKLNMGGGSDYSSSSPGNMNVTFNINTVDARGFDQLLTTRQDLIVGMINRALTERGKRSLV